MKKRSIDIGRQLVLFILISFITTSHWSCSSNATPKPVIRIVHDTVFIPHVAPDSAYLGEYERVKTPFIIPDYAGSKDSLVVENYYWQVDSGYHRYVGIAKGYLRKREKDGRIVDMPVTLEDRQRYDTFAKKQSGGYSLPIAKAPVTKAAPDSIHPATQTDEEKLKARLKKLRSVKLPYTYMVDSAFEVTITSRKVYTETIHDTIYLNTQITGTGRYPKRGTPPEDVSLNAQEKIE